MLLFLFPAPVAALLRALAPSSLVPLAPRKMYTRKRAGRALVPRLDFLLSQYSYFSIGDLEEQPLRTRKGTGVPGRARIRGTFILQRRTLERGFSHPLALCRLYIITHLPLQFPCCRASSMLLLLSIPVPVYRSRLVRFYGWGGVGDGEWEGNREGINLSAM